MAKGDEALAGRDEHDISSHIFPPDDSRDRKVKFRGLYISVYNEITQQRSTREENVEEEQYFDVPKGYSTFVRGVKVVSFSD